MNSTVEIWRDGEIESVDASEFLERARYGGLQDGALVRFQGDASFTEPSDLIPVVEKMLIPPVPEPESQPQRSLLEECPACQKTVSVEAKSCPHCGHPMRGPAPGRSAGNVVAAIASFFIPGLGQLSQGRLFRGLGIFLFALMLWFIMLGWIVHLVAAHDAATWTPPQSS